MNDSTVLEGTPMELEAMLRRMFESMRAYVTGWTSELKDGEFVPGKGQEKALDEFDRSVWRLELSPTGMTATTPVRTSLVERVGMMRTERELLGLLTPKS